MTATEEPEPPAGRRTRRAAVVERGRRLVDAIKAGDDEMVEAAVLALSRRSRWLAPLATVVGAFVMLFQGVKLLCANWRLTLVQVLPAMLVWAAMLDLKAHVFRGRTFGVVHGVILVPMVLGIAVVTAGAYYLNAVFAFAVSTPGPPQVRPALAGVRRHRLSLLGCGLVIGVALGVSATVVDRWGRGWYAVCLGAVVGVMMVTYVAIPSRLLGVGQTRSSRDRLVAMVIAGALSAVVCAVPYTLGRFAVVLLGDSTLRVFAIVALVVAVILQAGATGAVK